MASDAITEVIRQTAAGVMYFSNQQMIIADQTVGDFTVNRRHLYYSPDDHPHSKTGGAGPDYVFGGIIVTMMLDPVLAMVLIGIMPIMAMIIVVVSRNSMPFCRAATGL